jgi:hypothetical protein
MKQIKNDPTIVWQMECKHAVHSGTVFLCVNCHHGQSIQSIEYSSQIDVNNDLPKIPVEQYYLYLYRNHRGTQPLQSLSHSTINCMSMSMMLVLQQFAFIHNIILIVVHTLGTLIGY